MRVHYLQHDFFAEPGAITQWSAHRGYQLTGSKLFLGESLPKLESFDLLIVLGGIVSLRDRKVRRGFEEEIMFLQNSIAQNKSVLGICLGAQLIAESFSAPTRPSPFRETGIHPVFLTSEGKEDAIFSVLNEQFDTMHMHNDMASIPTNARLLARSDGCPVQAFAVGDRVYALQFHLEMTNDNIKLRLNHIEDELEQGKYLATREQLAAIDMMASNQKLYLLLDKLVENHFN